MRAFDVVNENAVIPYALEGENDSMQMEAQMMP